MSPDQKYEEYIEKLPIEVDFKHQIAITNLVVANGYNAPTSDDDCIWRAFRFRELDRTQVEPGYFSQFKRGDADYWSRHRVDLPWVWRETPVTEILMGYAKALEPYMKALTRVQAVVLKPGKELFAHRDLVAGSKYRNEIYSPYENIRFEPHDFHKNNRYRCLKMPLTELEGDNGRPFIKIGETEVGYDVGRNLFLIDEVRVQHGARSSAHHRGAIFFDGALK